MRNDRREPPVNSRGTSAAGGRRARHHVPHRGPVVSTISLEEAKQLYVARAVLEGFAGRECARLHDPVVVRRSATPSPN